MIEYWANMADGSLAADGAHTLLAVRHLSLILSLSLSLSLILVLVLVLRLARVVNLWLASR